MFENILGHENQKSIIENSIKANTISHAYLFSGPSGIGKYTFAKEFAKILLNANNLENCLDYIEISKKDDKKNILVEQIREEVIEDMYIAPSSGNRKVYVINDAEYLNDSSQNSLLKTLEEPPEYVCIILISSNNSSILPTVLSRVNKIEFAKLDEIEISRYFKNEKDIKLDKNIIEFADGSIGLASELVKENLINDISKLNELYDLVIKKDVIMCFKKCEEIDFNKLYILDYFEFMLYKNNKFFCVEIIEKTKERLKYNGNYDIVIDNMVLKCIDNI
ncbi:MAG: AAA family ATPase [Clostridia bacterium]